MKKLLVIVSLICAACSSTPEEDKKFNEESKREQLANEVKDEISIGRTMASKLLGVMGRYDKKRAHRYVNLVGHSLAANVGRPEIKFYFDLLNTDEVNAYAAPGGYIFLTKGLLKTLRSESELAAVLAHEIDHINSKHMYKDIAPKREVSTGENITRMMSRGASDIAGSLSQAVTAGMKVLMEEGYSKEKEYEADQNGILYVSTLGYDPGALLKLLKRIEKQKSTIKVSKTHPEFGPRIAALEKTMSEMGVSPGLKGKNKVLAKRFKRYFRKL